jgi:hypothetical protein
MNLLSGHCGHINEKNVNCQVATPLGVILSCLVGVVCGFCATSCVLNALGAFGFGVSGRINFFSDSSGNSFLDLLLCIILCPILAASAYFFTSCVPNYLFRPINLHPKARQK